MASQAEDYRAKAVKCEMGAASALDPHVKSQFEDLARQWRALAAQAEKAGR
jgi:hypothetical protein